MKYWILALGLWTLAPASATALQTLSASAGRIEPAVHEAMSASPDGRVPIVIAIEAFAPAGASVGESRAAIEEAQERLLADLSGGEFLLSCRYRTFAAIAGRADARALALLAEHPLVRSVGPSLSFKAALEQSVPHIGADQVHALGFTGEGITVAVLDSGIDTDHPDLADDLAPGAWHSLRNGTDQGPGAEDENGHGTHVSGIITSAGNDGPRGVAPDVEILAVKVLGADGVGTTIDVLAGIDYITASAPNYASLCALNMSLGTFTLYSECPCDDVDTLTTVVQDALRAAQSVGIATFAASGNEYACNSMAAPACVSAAAAVAASGDSNDLLADFSNRSACNKLAAPGRDITSSRMGGGVSTWYGTSMATPHCSAVAALLSQRAQSECLELTPDALIQLLVQTGAPTSDACAMWPSPPRIDALAALGAIDLEIGTPYCLGDGAAVPCPCTNSGATGHGCANAVFPSGALLGAEACVTTHPDSVVLTVKSARPNAVAVFVVGVPPGVAPTPYHNGLLCIGSFGGIVQSLVTDANGDASTTVSVSAASGTFSGSGDTRQYQVMYFEPGGGPCGAISTRNLSNGYQIVW